jgi:hypothetical protein
MNKGWLLFWSALLVGFGVSDLLSKAYGFATFEFIFGLGIGINLIYRSFIKEASE